MNDFITQAEQVLLPEAQKYCPEGTEPRAVVHQWLNAIAYEKSLFGIQNDAEVNRITAILKNHNLYSSGTELKSNLHLGLKLLTNDYPQFTFIDLFAGIGGFRLASQTKHGVCVFSSEFDKFAQDTYALNHGELPFGDITKINEDVIPNHDLLLAGFPCQPFSYSGRCEGFEDKTRGTLFFDVLRILESKKPKVALLENVKGFKSHDKGNTMYVALKALEEAGYNAYWTILNSYDYGVPQYRERWYCVAVRKDIDTGDFKFPDNYDRTTKLRDIVDLDCNEKSLFLNDFEIQRIKYHFKNHHKMDRVQHDNSIYEAHTKKGRHGVYSFLKGDGALRFHIGDVAKTQIQEAFYACLDTYAPTIIANRVPKLWDIERKLSVIESTRLQGFPDEFSFRVSNAQSYKQLGNSVTVNVIQALIENIVKIKGFI